MATYTVQRGDNLSKIARAYQMKSWRELYDMQPALFKATHKNPDLIFPGEKLKVPDVTAQDKARTLVEAFAGRKGGGAFSSIDRRPVAEGLIERVNTPSSIDQRAAGLCGAVSILYKLASTDPVRYVTLVTELYEKGKSRLGTLAVEPCDDVKAYAPSRIHPADWIPAASMRDSENWFLDQQSIDRQMASITLPHTMVKWLRALGFQQVEDHTNLVFNKSEENLKKALQSSEDDWWVFLFVDASVLGGTSTSTANHWIVLLSGKIVSQDVELEVYTWGSRQKVPATGALKVTDFLDDYYGFVRSKY